jgi:hypothetical protein
MHLQDLVGTVWYPSRDGSIEIISSALGTQIAFMLDLGDLIIDLAQVYDLGLLSE